MTDTVKSELDLVADSLAVILAGGELPEEVLYKISEIETTEGRQALRDAAAEVTRRKASRRFDFCSIVNARSGLCAENCKWCAQSVHYATSCDQYALIDADEAHEVAAYNAERGVCRFSMVASGRSVKGKALEYMASLLKDIRERHGISTCASLGLIGPEEMRQLKEAGVQRYHCNMETAPSFFRSLCSSHTQADKTGTIEAARAAGLEVCSGGIIGMGENRRQRMELAIFLRSVDPVSIPVNILAPIKGTPLESTPLISEDEIIDAVAMFRMAHPAVQLRLAGGRARISRPGLLELLRVGINGAIVGDLLTTLGSSIAEDKELARVAGYDID